MYLVTAVQEVGLADRRCSADLAEASAVVHELMGCIAAEFDLEQAGEPVEEAEEGSAEKTRTGVAGSVEVGQTVHDHIEADHTETHLAMD